MSSAGTAHAQKSQPRGAYAKPKTDVSPQEKAKLLQAGKDARAQALTLRGRTTFRPGTINLSKPSPLALGLRRKGFSAIARGAALSEQEKNLRGSEAQHMLAAKKPQATARANKPTPAGAQTPQAPAENPPPAIALEHSATDAAPAAPGVAAEAAPVKKSGIAETKPQITPAPPLDEWDEYVAKTAERYQFTDPQNARAQAILVGLRQRAQQYRMGRLPEFEAAETIQSPEARDARLRSLNRPIDELFAELKMRLENLPTIAQKLRAEQTPIRK